MKNKPTSQYHRELELLERFRMMTSDDIKTMMNETENTTTKLTCWEYLESLKNS